jgi:hypothetical protein
MKPHEALDQHIDENATWGRFWKVWVQLRGAEGLRGGAHIEEYRLIKYKTTVVRYLTRRGRRPGEFYASLTRSDRAL